MTILRLREHIAVIEVLQELSHYRISFTTKISAQAGCRARRLTIFSALTR
jgi:hypothetical protein